MKPLATRTAAVLLLLCVARAAPAQTADEIVERSITAMGGRAAHAKIKSRRSAGSITLETPAGNIAGTIEVLNAAPNKMRTLLRADLSALGAGQLVVDQRFDGHTGYALDSIQGNREITGGQLESLKNNSFPHIFLNYKEVGISVSLQGREKLGDREVFVLVFDPSTGPEVRQYIDAETYLPARAVSKVDVPQLGTTIEQTNDVSDYRDVDGLKLPFRIRSSSSVQSFTIIVKTVEHNVSVDEALFVKPTP